MGGCCSSTEDKNADIDIFLIKHHKIDNFSTNKANYEISQ